MNETEWKEYAGLHNPPAPTPDRTEGCLKESGTLCPNGRQDGASMDKGAS